MNYILIFLFFVFGIISRIFPHAPNFTPIISITLLSGLYIKNKFIILVPILIMVLSDLIIGNHITSFWIYSSLMIIFIIGYYSVRTNFKSIFIYSTISSFIFFILSNFGVWFSGGYTLDFNGIINCYIMAIPFYKNTLMSTLLFSSVFYCCNQIVSRYIIKYLKVH